ncbi:MAG: hypothetical protein ABR508_11675 [Candidatus Baltobacteraceae bacterium]
MHLLLAAVLQYGVLISAGHEGRPQSCAHFHHKCNLGAAGEVEWNTIVADAATRELRAHGVSVAREPADFAGTYDVDEAVFIHFDGADPPCTSKASTGYHTEDSQPLARSWRQAYAALFPFGFMPDNFTDNLRDYYGFRQVRARDGAIVIELGEITCPQQHAWLAPRLQLLGITIANVLLQWRQRVP